MTRVQMLHAHTDTFNHRQLIGRWTISGLTHDHDHMLRLRLIPDRGFLLMPAQ